MGLCRIEWMTRLSFDVPAVISRWKQKNARRLRRVLFADRSGFERRRLVGRQHTELSQCRMKEVMLNILLLQGANLTLLGRREPEIYGSTTPAELEAMLRSHAHDHAYKLEIFYTNIEGEAINRIYQAVDEGFNGLVMNP